MITTFKIAPPRGVGVTFTTNVSREGGGGTFLANTIYRGCMGRLLLIVLAAIAAFMLLGIVVSALHFIFWVAVVALIVVVGMRLTSGARRRSRR
jgi:predicted membrane protein